MDVHTHLLLSLEWNVEWEMFMPSISEFSVLERYNDSSIAFEAFNDFQVLLSQVEVKDLAVFLNAFACHRLGDDNNAALNLPTKQNLSTGFAVLLGYLQQTGIVQKFWIVWLGPRTVRRT